MFNRRSFIASLIASATLDPEKLLWVPGRKVISIPAYRPNLLAFYSFGGFAGEDVYGDRVFLSSHTKATSIDTKFLAMRKS